MTLKDLVIGRGGFVATRNYELDSGAYFLCHLYDYYVAEDIYRPDAQSEIYRYGRCFNSCNIPSAEANCGRIE